MRRDRPTAGDRVVNAAARLAIGTALVLPYRRRVPAFGWFAARVAAPLAGWDARVRDNLARIFPDMPEAEVRRLVRAVPDMFGRALIEMYSGEAFKRRVRDAPVRGDGLPALEEARGAGRPVLLVTGHFGSYDAARLALIQRGFRVGGLYNPMANPLFNAHYVRAMESLSTPVFERSRRGMAQMVRFLREGGMVGIVADQHMRHGVPLDFMGQPAWTALSAAELALKYDALAVPAYGIRRPDGLHFEVEVHAPLPRGTPEEMTQAMNDSLAAMVRRYPEQWFWIHRRWKSPADTAPGPG